MAGAVVATDHIVPPGMPGYFPDLKPLAFNPAEAKRELAQVGNVGRLSLSFTTGQADFDKVAATVGQMWKQNLGLDVRINGEEQGKFNDDLTAMANDPTKSTLEMYISVWGADYPDPQNFLTQQLHSGVGNNNGHWSDPDFDRLTDQADVERDATKRMDLYHQAEQIAIDKVGWLPLYNSKGSILIRPTVKGLSATRVNTRHVLRNALLPIVTVLGPSTAFLVTGAFVVESLFTVPGIGFLAVQSIGQRDYPIIQATTLLLGFAVVVMNLVTDLLYTVLDPRIRSR
jgi:ABC-type oligopeptide transport system substrate-binding subunit